MISYKVMQREFERIPKLMKQAFKEGNARRYFELETEYWTLNWILNSNDKD